MDSKTKIKIDEKQLQAVAGRIWGKDGKIKKIEFNNEGWFNSIYQLTLADDREYMMKIAPPRQIPVLRYEKDILKKEAAVLEYIKTNSDVPVPEVIFKDYSSELVPEDFFVMSKLKGKSLENMKGQLSEEKLSSINREKGSVNRKINEINSNDFGHFTDNSQRFSNWADAFMKMVEDLMADAVDYKAKLPLSAGEIIGIFNRQYDNYKSMGKASLVHWDLWDGNVIIGPEGDIQGIIDCDRAYWGDPLSETWFSLMFPQPEEFFAGYGTDLLSSENAVARRKTYDLYLALILYIECIPRGLEGSGYAKWAYQNLEKELQKRQKDL